MSTSGIPGLGWVPDVPSVKDYTERHNKVAPLLAKTRLRARVSPARKGQKRAGAAAAAPGSVDLRADFSSVENQGNLGSCTANAAVGLIEYFERKASGGHIDASRLFVYKASRNLLGWTGDTGAYIRTAMGALVLFGAPPERYWPYDGSPEATNPKFDMEPPAFCYAFAAQFQALLYLRLDDTGITGQQLLTNIKSYLAAGFPSMFGFPVYEEFMHPNSKSQIAFPSPTSPYYGGHAIVAAGYDDNMKIGSDKGALLIRNSWGQSWGDHGYGWMSYRYVTEELAVDWWTLLKSEWVDTGNF